MASARRPFLSLFLCLTLAVNLVASYTNASPLFVEICSGHRTILIPAEGAPDPSVCDTCLVCCLGFTPPDNRVSVPLGSSVIVQPMVALHAVFSAPMPRRLARAPPLLSV